MGIVHHALLLALLAQSCVSWTHSTTVDLAWPPFLASAYSTINSTVQATDNPDFFPCSRLPISSSTPRVFFPITGGRLQFNLTNTTDLITYEFIGTLYIGQFSNDNTPARNASAGITTYVWKDFRTGPDCGETLNLTREVNDAFDREDMQENEIVGINATIAIRNTLFSTDINYDYPRDVYNVESLYQCGYITIVPAGISTQAGDFCNSEEGIAYIASVSEASVAATATSSRGPRSSASVALSSTTSRITSRSVSSGTAISSNPGSTASTSSSSQPTLESSGSAGTSPSAQATNIGIGVGVSVGASIILLIIGIFLFRRRKQRKGTLGPEFIVSRQEPAENGEKKGVVDGNMEKKMEVKMKGGLGGEESLHSGGSSVKEEALPAYSK